MKFGMKYRNLLLGCLSLFILTIFSLPVLSIAQSSATNPPPPSNTSYQITIPNPLKNSTNSLPALLNLIIDNVILPIGGVIIVVMIIYSGFMFVTAQGNETKLTTAKNSLLYAAIGAAILLGARVIAAAIQGTISQLG